VTIFLKIGKFFGWGWIRSAKKRQPMAKVFGDCSGLIILFLALFWHTIRISKALGVGYALVGGSGLYINAFLNRDQ
jgi:hypothetical protein